MKILFDDLASLEYNEAIGFYELQVKGLGMRFRDEVKRALRNIRKFPEIGPIEKGTLRKYILHKFPFKIIYSNEENYIYITAIAHMHREPDYWINRTKSK